MKTSRVFALLSLFVGLALIPTLARAQTGAPDSDVLTESITDAAGVNILPPGRISIPENAAEGPVGITIPKLDIDFLEAVGANTQISDRLHLNQFNVQVTSDLETSLPPRTGINGLITIPATANELFLPLSIFAHSDGNPTQPDQTSDGVTIYAGFYGQPGITPLSDLTILEPTGGEPVPESVTITVPPLHFDVAQVDEFGNPTGLISDYVDLPDGLTGFFLSSDNPQDYLTLPPADGTIFEDPANGALLHYNLGFASDVPEPAALAGLTLAVCALGLRRRRAAA